MDDTELWSPARASDDLTSNNKDAEDGTGYKSRHIKTSGGNIIELIGKIHTDINRQTKYLPTGCEMRITCTRTPTNFHMIRTDEGKIYIMEAILKVRSVQVSTDANYDINQQMLTENMKIPINHVEIKTFSVPAGLSSNIESNLFGNQLPKRIFGQVKNSNMNGNNETSPYLFEPFDIRKLQINVDGNNIEQTPLKMNFTSDTKTEIVQAYNTFWKALCADHGKDLGVYSLDTYFF